MKCFLHDGPAGAEHVCHECLEKRGLGDLTVGVRENILRRVWDFTVRDSFGYERPYELAYNCALLIDCGALSALLVEPSDWAAWRPKPAAAPVEQPKTYEGDTLRPDLPKRISEW